jgi:hypothetical protein
MHIDIRKVPTYYINLPKERSRSGTLYKELWSNGFEDIRRFPAIYDVDRLGCSKSHNMILEHIIKINEYPVLILEDDVKILNHNFVLEIPPKIDAMYLGISKHGADLQKEKKVFKKIFISELDEQKHRVHNMVSRHAVIHFNKEYDQKSIESNNNFMKNKSKYFGGDVALSELNKKSNVYALNKPIFYQNDIKTIFDTKLNLDQIDYTIL